MPQNESFPPPAMPVSASHASIACMDECRERFGCPLWHGIGHDSILTLVSARSWVMARKRGFPSNHGNHPSRTVRISAVLDGIENQRNAEPCFHCRQCERNMENGNDLSACRSFPFRHFICLHSCMHACRLLARLRAYDSKLSMSSSFTASKATPPSTSASCSITRFIAYGLSKSAASIASCLLWSSSMSLSFAALSFLFTL